MSQRLSDSADESTHGLLGEWNLTDGDDPAQDSEDSLLAPPTKRDQPVAKRANSTGRSVSEDLPYHNFAFEADNADDDSLLGPSRAAVDLPATGLPGPQAPAARSAAVPRQGDVVGGFVILAELGRGAFARVYLAEEVELGRRLVALKVSKAEGDEPQLLARLQHTHIVPIHSVHDDPETGLRLLCMPYLGGANLAQVLEAADARRRARHGPQPRRGP